MVWKFYGKYGSTAIQHALGDGGDEGRDSKVGEDAIRKCAFSNAFNAIMETNRTSE
jgi:hypothetical protein